MKLYGYSEDEVIGKPVSILASADYPDEIPSILEKIRHGEHIDHYETVRKRKDGGIINVSLSVSPIKDSKGRLVGASTITRDITEKKRSEEAIRLASAYNRSLIEASLDPLVTISPDGRITDVNRATEAVTGYTREYLIGTDFSDYFTGPQKAKEGYLKVFKEGSVTDYPLEIRHRDGHVTPVIYNASVYRDESGNVIGVFAAARDITERRRAENALRDAKDQVELYVDLMGHDINNMNQVSMGFLELAHNIIEMEGKLGEENIVLLDKAMDSLKNSSQLIDNVRKLQREKMGLYEPEVLDVCSVTEDAIKQFHGIPGRDVRITCEPFEGCPVRANSLLKDVFINLVGNAIKHSRGSLSINIGASRVVDNGKAYCRVDVEDDGPGIPDQLKSTLFDRLSLSTTRARGKGFGLCLIKMLVDDYRGRFWAEDRVPGDHSKGARFVVMLPAVVD
jgi:PAS domain S-box-containing protein